MKLARFVIDDEPPLCGLVDGDSLVPVGDGDQVLELAMRRRLLPATGSPVLIAEAELLPPVATPPSIRCFEGFEEHARALRRTQGFEIDESWRDVPSFHFVNPASVIGPDDPVVPPRLGRMLDFGACLAAVIGHETVGDEAGPECIAGFTIVNDWALRDVELRERRTGTGPAKASDFATSMGPWLMTPDEMPGWRDARTETGLVARLNGEQWGSGDFGDMVHSWEDLVVCAATGTRLRPGDVLAVGPAAGGAILGSAGADLEGCRWLEPGDVVELHVEAIGTLTNTVGG